jgi:hypothetical protein
MANIAKLAGVAPSIRTYTSLQDTFILPQQKIGIEIEVEGYKRSVSLSLWEKHDDNSLRESGKEFTTIGDGLFGDDLERAIMEIMDAAHKNKWIISERTGIHIHMDMTNLETKKSFLYFCILYAYYELPLFKFIGIERYHNIFCLPWQKAQGIISYVNSIANGDREMKGELNNLQRSEKYSALNFGTLGTYGTVEFRHMKTEFDAKRLIVWINLLMSLKKSALAFDKKFKNGEEVINYLSDTEADVLCAEIFGTLMENFDLLYLQEDTKKGLALAYDLLENISFGNKWSISAGTINPKSPALLFVNKHKEKN